MSIATNISTGVSHSVYSFGYRGLSIQLQLREIRLAALFEMIDFPGNEIFLPKEKYSIKFPDVLKFNDM
jgi:hypothetical protein